MAGGGVRELRVQPPDAECQTAGGNGTLMSSDVRSPITCHAVDAPIVRLVELEGAFHLFSALLETLHSRGYQVRTYDSVEAMLLQETSSASGCVVLGVQTLGSEGLELHQLLASKSSLPVILVTSNATPPDVVRAMKQGAADFFCNPLNEEALFAAVDKAVVDHQTRAASGQRHAEFQLRRASLSTRELQVYELLVRGATNKEMGVHMGLAERTIKHHRSRVMEKLGVKTVIQLVQAVGCASVDTAV